MAKNFGAKNGNAFNKVKEVEAVKAKVLVIKNIHTSNLLNDPNNNEDIDRTEDLELSMKQQGFTDPIEVTDFGMVDDKYMILSGHRRRGAGVKVGIDYFPCIIRHFENENDVANYRLLANSQRDSVKDVFLFSKRYKMHEDYLVNVGFEGSKREEIAKRLGLSTQQADRYNAFNKIILSIWDMVREEKVGMSSVVPLASKTIEQQEAIYEIMKNELSKGKTLNRDYVKNIIDVYIGKVEPVEDDVEPMQELKPVEDDVEPMQELKPVEDDVEPMQELKPVEDDVEPMQELKPVEDDVEPMQELKPVEDDVEPMQELKPVEDDVEPMQELKSVEDDVEPMQEADATVVYETEVEKTTKKLLKMLDGVTSVINTQDKICDNQEKALVLMEKFQEVSRTLIEEMLTLSIEHNLKNDFSRFADEIESDLKYCKK